MTKVPFVVQKCTILLLHPNLFLPNNCPLFINTNHGLQVSGGPPIPQSKQSSWVSCNSQPYTNFLKNPSGPPFTEFNFKSLHCPEDSLSVFSLLVNSHSKLQSLKHIFKKGILDVYAQAIEATIDAIFHIPRVQNEAPADHQGDITKGNYPNPNIDFEDDYNLNRDDDPDKINRLSFSEIDTLLQQVSDGGISGQEWADAAIMMLRMAGHQETIILLCRTT